MTRVTAAKPRVNQETQAGESHFLKETNTNIQGRNGCGNHPPGDVSDQQGRDGCGYGS